LNKRYWRRVIHTIVGVKTPKVIEAAPATPAASNEKIYSPLAANNPKFQAIVEQFVVRLEERVQHMNSCLAEGDFQTLGEMGHWLKGSGGTVGFNQFVEPAQALEVASKAADKDQCELMMAEIEQIQSRLSVDTQQDGDSGGQDEHSVTNASISPSANANKVDKPVLSTLPMDNPRFRAVVERFIPRLDEQQQALKEAAEQDDFEEIASIAHWLKGSGGNVGFHDYTEIAQELEDGAKRRDKDAVNEKLQDVFLYTERVRAGWDSLPTLKKIA